MFDAIARRYDLLNRLLSAGIDRSWRRRAVRSLALSGRERVLDVCTGTADLAIAARGARPGAAEVVGVDFAGAMLRVGLQKLRRQQIAGIRLVRGDATCLPVATSAMDAATVAFGIRNVQDLDAAVLELARVLRPGGRLAILEFSLPKSQLVRVPYLWYFHNVLPRIGRALSRHNAAYEYLPASVGAFASPQELVTILERRGFADVAAAPLTLGIAFLYTARKP